VQCEYIPLRQYSHLACRNAGDQHAIARPKSSHASANAVYYADTFVAKDATWFAGRDVILEDVQIGSANGCLRDFYDGIRGCR
jgi:hypothetical protein